MACFANAPEFDMNSSGLYHCALHSRGNKNVAQANRNNTAMGHYMNTARKENLPHSVKTDRMFPPRHFLSLPLTFPTFEWDGSRIDRRYHSGRTDSGYGHNDYQNSSGLGQYHYHHTLGAHIPYTHFILTSESLIDLFKEYDGSVWTSTHVSDGKTTYSFHATIEVEPNEQYFTLDITGHSETSAFFIAANATKTHVEPFFGTPLNPKQAKRESSPWNGTMGGFDYLVDAEYFYALVEKYTEFSRPHSNHFDQELYNGFDWYKRHADYISQITSSTNDINAMLELIKQAYYKNKVMYQEIALKSNIPTELIAALHYRENSNDFLNGNFDVYLHNGQELGYETTIAPIGKLFQKGQFVEASIDALKGTYNLETQRFYFEVRRDQLKLTSSSKDIIAMTAFAIFFNGTGGDLNGLTSYGYNGTNIYAGGLYTSDGNYDPNAIDKNLGVYVILSKLVR